VLSRIGVIGFSLFYWTTAFAIMFVGAVLSIALRVLGFPYQRVHMWVTAPLFAVSVPLSLTRLRVHVHPGFDSEQRSVFVQNHINLIDGMVASCVIPHAFSGLMNAWQFKLPIYGWMMSVSKGIAVDRSCSREETIRKLSEAAAERRRIGMSVLTFPEGHRTKDGTVQPFRRGVFLMARNANMPVVPIVVRGMYEVNRKGSLLFFPGREVDVFVGPQIDTRGLTDDEIPRFAEQVRQFTLHCFEHNTWPESVEGLEARLCGGENVHGDQTSRLA